MAKLKGLIMKEIKLEDRTILVPAGTHEGKMIVLCADHRGVSLKNHLNDNLHILGYRTVDVGTFNGYSCDYPFYVQRAVDKIRSYERGAEPAEQTYAAVGIGVCGSGQGMAMAANRLGMYAVVCDNPSGTSEEVVQRIAETRMHNNSDFLAIAADRINSGLAAKVAVAWLAAEHFGDGMDKKYSIRWDMLRQMNFRNGIYR